ncbi:MAG: amidohydrolase [Oscillospiraceae bacterium]|nr:amidohydrolase [Oscillospiraceae bacterium]
MNSLADTIRALIAKYDSYYISTRRQVHVFAETGGNEYKTSAFIEKELMELGITVEKVSNTGLIGTLDTGRAGKTLALRADIDALPVAENPSNLRRGRVCVSENAGSAHLCGHDAHTAMLLGAAKVLVDIQSSLTGKILFCFEEGEEVGLGFKGMVETLRAKQIDAVLATHVLSTFESGKINISPGPRMAGGRMIRMRVNGKGGHGSRPDLAINPVYAAAAIVANLPGALQNKLNPEKPVTVGITAIQGGETENVFPDYADIKGTMRFFDAKEGAKAADVLKTVAESTAKMLGCTIDYDPSSAWLLKPVINDRAISERAVRAISKLGLADALAECPLWYASESFSAYLAEFPGALVFLGIKNDEYGSGAPHHNERFDVDEAVLALGVAAAVGFVVEDVI